MKELIIFITQSLVDHPEQVQVLEEQQEHGIHFEIKVAEEDIGQMIGKNGRTAKAIRSVVIAAATRKKEHVTIHISEEG